MLRLLTCAIDRVPAVAFSVALLSLLAGCGGSPATRLHSTPPPGAGLPPASSAWPAALPRDAIQPWEQLGASGHAEPQFNAEHAASSINLDSVFVPGVERFQDGGGATDLGEACRLVSGAAQASFAIYRLVLDGAQPGAVSVDANIKPRESGGQSSYFIGLSDYVGLRWEWHGPFSDSHVRLGRSAAGAQGPDLLLSDNYLSPLGNLFLTVLAFDGAAVDVVGVGANGMSPGDTAAPPAPSGLSLAPVQGGLMLQWNSVIAGDLAGYRLYHSASAFTQPSVAGADRVPYLEGATRHFLPVQAETFCAVAAVDINGNESPISAVVPATPLAGTAPEFGLELSQPSVMRGEALTLSVTSPGGLSFDYDLDGDGVFEITASAELTQFVDTSAAGLVRPGVRAADAPGERQALGGVTLVVLANSRPAASASASAGSGNAPLSVTFTGEADDMEDPAEALTYSWDFNGDGVFEAGTDTLTPAAQDYPAPGLYNVKFRVEDSLGAWDVDTVAVLAIADPNNLPPQITALGANPALALPASDIQFSASAVDPDGAIASYAWDFDNDGATESTLQNPQHTFAAVGLYNVKLTVTDDSGASDTDLVSVSIEADPANLPPVITVFAATPSGGDAPLAVAFDFDGTDANGTIDEFAIDYENDGTFDFTTASAGTHNANYGTAGFYTACLRVTDDEGSTSTSFLSVYATPPGVNLPPVITQFSVTPSSGEAPLDVDFTFNGTDPDGSVAEYAIDYADDATFDFTTASAGTVNHVYGSVGLVNARLRITDSDGATTTTYVTIYPSLADVNIPPVASLVAERNTTLVGASSSVAINFDASASYDPEGGALEYAFDFDGNGSFNGYSADPTQTGSYLQPGIYLAAVKVRDAAGKESVATTLMKLYRLDPRLIDNGSNTADATAVMATTGTFGGRIGFAYSDAGANDNLMFALCDDQSGNNWRTPVVLDANGGQWMSFIQGVTQFNLAYYRDGDLFFKASQNDGTTFNISATVDTGAGDDVGNYCSAVSASSRPAICYHNQTDGDLYFIRATNSSGSGWADPPVVVDGTGDTGEFTSMVSVGSRPAIAYYRRDNGNLMYVRAADTTGATWNTPVVVDNSTDDVGQYASMAIVGGNPAIAYWNATDNTLMYVRATDTTGTAWGTPELVANFAGKSCRLVVANGRVVILYHENTATAYFVESIDSVGSSWTNSQRIEGVGHGGNLSATLMTNGQPLIGYRKTGGGAKVAVSQLE